MIQRCTNPCNPAYPNYGGRGIKVCARWMKFNNFISDMGHRPTDKHSIERKDNNRGYTPDNCKWSTRYEQNRNKRTNHLVTLNGKTKCFYDWCGDMGISAQTVYGRLKRGWPMEEALTRVVSISENCSKWHRARQQARTHCSRGHEFTEATTHWKKLPTGGYGIICRTCENTRMRLRSQGRQMPRIDRRRAIAKMKRAMVQIGNAASSA